ncbi:MAG TPA: helix-turn-helix transcriptional regulator [Candidatus Lokiarchaeia archaeon]
MSEDLIYSAKFYITNNYSSIRHLDEIARHLYCSYNTLRIQFAKQNELTLRKYLNKYRCQKAAELLTMTDWKIYRVAEEVGFHNEKYFTKVFEKNFKYPPKKYRNLFRF